MVFTMTGCEPSGSRGAGMTSTMTAADVAYLRHDSLVIDSIVRTVRTDSLYRLYRAMLYAADPTPIYQEVFCEGSRLSDRHGIRASTIAKKRMQDTLWKHGEERLYNSIYTRMPSTYMFTVSDSTCGPMGPPPPDSIDGVSLRYAPRLPALKPKSSSDP